MLCDAGPLVALIDEDDFRHLECKAALKRLPPTIITTWPCLTEAMHLLNRAGGINAQEDLWSYIVTGELKLHLPAASEWRRVKELMTRYADMPLDLADASLICAAEQLQDFQLFTIDASLRAVRLSGGQHLQILP
jgi:predicted nucleic acid-binding protein